MAEQQGQKLMTNSYGRLTEQELRQLLLQKEGPTLDFKREWYKIGKSYGPETRDRESGELIKDILALANSNADFAGDTSYLIVGVDDRPRPDGNPQLFSVVDSPPPQKELQQKINEVCSPPLGHLYIDPYEIDGQQLYVIAIPPSPHLYEIAQEIKTPRRVFPEHTVFVRHGEHIEIASTRERITLLQIRRGRFRDSRNAPAWLVGATSGAVVGSILAYNLGDAVLSGPSNLSSKEKKLISGITGTGAGAFLGLMLGQGANYLKETIMDWPRKPLWDRLLSLVPWLAGPLAGKLWSDWSRSRKAK